jgi:hypothetical protein
MTTNVSGLVALVNAVSADFTARGISANGKPVKVLVGLKAYSLWSVPRVVFIPGKFDGTLPPKALEEGKFGSPEHTKSDNPRELVTWERLITCAVYSSDESDIQDELLQIAAIENLLEATIQSIKNAFTPNLAVVGGDNRERGYTGQQSAVFDDTQVTRIYPPVEFSHGACLLFTFTQRGPLFDVPIATVTPTVKIITKAFANPAPPS